MATVSSYLAATRRFVDYDTEWNDLPWFHGDPSPAEEVAREVDAAAKLERIWPRPAQLYRALALTVPADIRVLLLGQDPYFTADTADGLAFSVPHGRKIPPSLRNVFTELQIDTGIRNTSGFLRPWAYSGVLLLNTALTVVEGRAGSHAALWGSFGQNVFDFLNARRQPVVFMLWGAQAHRMAQGGINGQHLVIRCTHPSPLSAHRGGWFGSKPFSRANRFLRNHGREIDWRTHQATVGKPGADELEPYIPLEGGLVERLLAARQQQQEEPRRSVADFLDDF